MTPDKPLILFAEDDPDDRMLLEEACAEDPTDYDVHFVEDGEKLLDALHGARPVRRPRLVVLDLNMPRVDGREALTEIRTQPHLATLPVVVFTTSNSPADIVRCYELGASSFIIKPSSFQDLVATIRAISHYWLRVVEPLPGDSKA